MKDGGETQLKIWSLVLFSVGKRLSKYNNEIITIMTARAMQYDAKKNNSRAVLKYDRIK